MNKFIFQFGCFGLFCSLSTGITYASGSNEISLPVQQEEKEVTQNPETQAPACESRGYFADRFGNQVGLINFGTRRSAESKDRMNRQANEVTYNSLTADGTIIIQTPDGGMRIIPKPR